MASPGWIGPEGMRGIDTTIALIPGLAACTSMSADHASQPLLKTPLHALHIELGAKMVPFGGYDMPVQYAAGILAEHRHTRAAAGLFDVSHMG